MAGELPLSGTERDWLVSVRVGAAAEAENLLDKFDSELERLAFLAGLAEVCGQFDDVVRAARDGGVWWTSIAWAVGDLPDPGDEAGCLRAGRRVSSAWRRREDTRSKGGSGAG